MFAILYEYSFPSFWFVSFASQQQMRSEQILLIMWSKHWIKIQKLCKIKKIVKIPILPYKFTSEPNNVSNYGTVLQYDTNARVLFMLAICLSILCENGNTRAYYWDLVQNLQNQYWFSYEEIMWAAIVRNSRW